MSWAKSWACHEPVCARSQLQPWVSRQTSVWGLAGEAYWWVPSGCVLQKLWLMEVEGGNNIPAAPLTTSASCFCQLCLQQFSVCSHLSPRTQMIVLDQVHQLSSLGRLFIIMYRVYKPLPATVGQHRVRPGAQHPPHPSCEHSTELDQRRHTAPPQWHCQGEREQPGTGDRVTCAQGLQWPSETDGGGASPRENWGFIHEEVSLECSEKSLFSTFTYGILVESWLNKHCLFEC